MMREHLRRMARYNRWANDRLYDACGSLTEGAYLAERGMFFGSIHGTLNHILVGDLHWLSRILRRRSSASTTAPAATCGRYAPPGKSRTSG